ncbi:hypothetical protein D3C73_724820 [compost metagenome]
MHVTPGAATVMCQRRAVGVRLCRVLDAPAFERGVVGFLVEPTIESHMGFAVELELTELSGRHVAVHRHRALVAAQVGPP